MQIGRITIFYVMNASLYIKIFNKDKNISPKSWKIAKTNFGLQAANFLPEMQTSKRSNILICPFTIWQDWPEQALWQVYRLVSASQVFGWIGRMPFLLLKDPLNTASVQFNQMPDWTFAVKIVYDLVSSKDVCNLPYNQILISCKWNGRCTRQ